MATEAPWECHKCTYLHAGVEAAFLMCTVCQEKRKGGHPGQRQGAGVPSASGSASGTSGSGAAADDPCVIDDDGDETGPPSVTKGAGARSGKRSRSSSSSTGPNGSKAHVGAAKAARGAAHRSGDSDGHRSGSSGAGRAGCATSGRSSSGGGGDGDGPSGPSGSSGPSGPSGSSGPSGLSGPGNPSDGSGPGGPGASSAGSNRAGKQPIRNGESTTDVPTADGRGASLAASAPFSGEGSSSGLSTHVPYQIGQLVLGRWWAFPRQRPMPQYFWPAKVVAVNTDDGTVDLEYEPDRDGASECFYSRVNLRYVKAKPTPVDDGPVSVAIVPASDCPEDPLIEIRRRKNIAELKELLIRLGLDQPLIPPRPKPRPPKPRPPPATSPADRRHQRRGAAVAQPLRPYEIGFDFAFCGAPLAWQYIAIRDLLTSCYGDAAAVDILTRFCTIDGKLRRDPQPLELFVFASVGFTVIGAMVVRWQTCTAMGRQLVEVVFTAIAPEVESPDTIRRVLESYAEVVAQLSLHHALLLAWHDPGAPTCAEDTRWQRGECSGFGGVALAPPAHTADFVLCVCEPRHNAWKHFQLAVARAVAALVRADSQALKDVQTAATGWMLQAASRTQQRRRRRSLCSARSPLGASSPSGARWTLSSLCSESTPCARRWRGIRMRIRRPTPATCECLEWPRSRSSSRR